MSSCFLHENSFLVLVFGACCFLHKSCLSHIIAILNNSGHSTIWDLRCTNQTHSVPQRPTTYPSPRMGVMRVYIGVQRQSHLWEIGWSPACLGTGMKSSASCNLSPSHFLYHTKLRGYNERLIPHALGYILGWTTSLLYYVSCFKTLPFLIGVWGLCIQQMCAISKFI